MPDPNKVRCVNIDWLEVYCLEPFTHDAAYFQRHGYSDRVRVRDYGTPQYKQMFTLLDTSGQPLIEVRRDPYSLKQFGGIFPIGACHLRLSNRQCYSEAPVAWLMRFLRQHDYNLVSTSRLDLCLDFAHFDCNQNPARFLRDYYAGQYAKINQAKFQAHGRDAWEDKTFNSVKWGSEFSKITTKLYNKTQELNRDGHDKPYIRASWKAADLPEDHDIWRIEFSMKSECKSLVKACEIEEVDTDTGELSTAVGERQIDISLWNVLGKSDWTALFFALIDHYFDFRYVERTRSGALQRKDRCRRVPLFRLSAIEQGYTFKRLNVTPRPGRREKMMMKYLDEIIADPETWGRDAMWTADNLRQIFQARYAFARTREPIDNFFKNPDRAPLIVTRHDYMTDEQYRDYLQKTREIYANAITNFIKRSPEYARIKKKIEDQYHDEILDSRLPF